MFTYLRVCVCVCVCVCMCVCLSVGVDPRGYVFVCLSVLTRRVCVCDRAHVYGGRL